VNAKSSSLSNSTWNPLTFKPRHRADEKHTQQFLQSVSCGLVMKGREDGLLYKSK